MQGFSEQFLLPRIQKQSSSMKSTERVNDDCNIDKEYAQDNRRPQYYYDGQNINPITLFRTVFDK